ncbi:carbohydrate sulfotransferase 11-like [Amphiura filiformis]|uniref:carbohydrate sulfotransferase 11-like n=1 Tax=Amphiura filiformis TaxID=82378 RepID=UPI003B219E94
MFIRGAKKLLIAVGIFVVFYFLFLLFLNTNKLDAHTKDQNQQRIRYGAFKKPSSKRRTVEVNTKHDQPLITEPTKKGKPSPIKEMNMTPTMKLVMKELQPEQMLPDDQGAIGKVKKKGRLPIDSSNRQRQRLQMQPLLAGFDSDDMDDMTDIVKWEKEQANRVHKMRETCRSLSPSSKPLSQWLKVHHAHLRHILVSDEYRTLYCYVPKAACTNWKKAFLYLNGMVENEDEARLLAHKQNKLNKTTLAKYSEEEALFRLQNYSKFIFVRNPMTRILSGYREKFALSERRGRRNWSVNLGNAIHFQFSNHTLTNFRDLPRSGFNVSFREFVRYLGSKRARFDLPGSEHWKPMTDMCFPCHVQYDAIGKFETFDFDAKQILRTLKRDDLQKVVLEKSDHSTGSSGGATLRKYYSELTRSEMKGLNWRYRTDISLFGYIPFK